MHSSYVFDEQFNNSTAEEEIIVAIFWLSNLMPQVQRQFPNTRLHWKVNMSLSQGVLYHSVDISRCWSSEYLNIFLSKAAAVAVIMHKREASPRDVGSSHSRAVAYKDALALHDGSHWQANLPGLQVVFENRKAHYNWSEIALNERGIAYKHPRPQISDTRLVFDGSNRNGIQKNHNNSHPKLSSSPWVPHLPPSCLKTCQRLCSWLSCNHHHTF